MSNFFKANQFALDKFFAPYVLILHPSKLINKILHNSTY